jgi:hypothetical protein
LFFTWLLDLAFQYFGRRNVLNDLLDDQEDVDRLNMWNLFNLAKDSDE